MNPVEAGLPASAAELIENFGLFDTWEERYTYLVDLGKRLPPLPESERTDVSKVQGCMSQVWFVRRDDPLGRLVWDGDSDASIVRGLIAILQVLYGQRTLEEAAAVDVVSVFSQIGLEGHLSMNRRNGFFSMVSRLRDWAATSDSGP